MSWDRDLFALFDDPGHGALTDPGGAEYGQVSLAGRLMACVDSEITLNVAGVGALEATLQRVADGWLLLADEEQDWVVRTAAVRSVESVSVRAIPEEAWPPFARVDVGSAVRRIAESGERCLVRLIDGAEHEGTLRRVGQDFCEVVTAEQRRTVLVPFVSIAAVRSRR